MNIHHHAKVHYCNIHAHTYFLFAAVQYSLLIICVLKLVQLLMSLFGFGVTHPDQMAALTKGDVMDMAICRLPWWSFIIMVLKVRCSTGKRFCLYILQTIHQVLITGGIFQRFNTETGALRVDNTPKVHTGHTLINI